MMIFKALTRWLSKCFLSQASNDLVTFNKKNLSLEKRNEILSGRTFQITRLISITYINNALINCQPFFNIKQISSTFFLSLKKKICPFLRDERKRKKNPTLKRRRKKKKKKKKRERSQDWFTRLAFSLAASPSCTYSHRAHTHTVRQATEERERRVCVRPACTCR